MHNREHSRQPEGQYGRYRGRGGFNNNDEEADYRGRERQQMRDYGGQAEDGERGHFGSDERSDRFSDVADRHATEHDADYARWRQQQMDELDQDYMSWQSERRKKFSDEFEKWRSERKGKAQSSTENQKK